MAQRATAPAQAGTPSRSWIRSFRCALIGEGSTMGCWADCCQNFYAKAAVLILQSRINTTPVGRREDGRKTNHWVRIRTLNGHGEAKHLQSP
jgi:hypothetical protein